MGRRTPATTPAQAVAAAIDTEQRSTEMATHLTEMTQAVMQAGVLYRDLGMAIAVGPRPTTAAVRDAHRAGLDAERAIRRFQRTFHDWVHALDRASRVGMALHAAPTPQPASAAASVH